MLDFHTVYRVQMRNKGCKGHLEFRIASGNGGTGRAAEAQMNMDVNLRRLPKQTNFIRNS